MEISIAQAYKGKKVFLTGHTGFKGSWLLAWLHSLGAIVKGYALAAENKDGAFLTLPGTVIFQSVLADIRNKERLRKEIMEFEPDYIFHLAAQPLVRYSYLNPAETFDVNVTGTANLLEAASALTGKCAIVVITTDKVYHNNEWMYPYRENDKLGGYDPYSASKACTELVVDSFRNSFFNIQKYDSHKKAIASARSGNVIGGGDWSTDRILPDIVRALSSQTKVEVRNPSAVRPWQHVLEPLEGYLRLGALLYESPASYSKAYNFGPLPNEHVKVGELTAHAIKEWGSGEWVDASNKAAEHEAGLLTLDINLAKEELGWQPKFSQKKAVSFTIEWYKHYLACKESILLEQIKHYGSV